jgi:hypothetical protein
MSTLQHRYSDTAYLDTAYLDTALTYSSPWPWALALAISISIWLGAAWLIWTLAA